MTLFMKCLVICLLLSVGCVNALLRDSLKWISSYPEEIQSCGKALGSVDDNKKFITCHYYWFHIKRSVLGMLLMIPFSLLVGLCVMVFA